MATVDESVATARRSRAQCGRHAQTIVETLAAEVDELDELRPIDAKQLRALEGRVPLAQQKLTNFAEAVVRCQALEDLQGERPSNVDELDLDPHEERSDALESLFIRSCGLLSALRYEYELAVVVSNPEPNVRDGPSRGSAKRMDVPKLKSPEDMKLVDFRDWRVRFEDFAAITRLAEDCNREARRGILRSAIHEDWTKLWAEGVIAISDAADTPEIMSALENYLRDKRHPLVDRRTFIQRDQEQGESVEAYYAALRSLDRDCGYVHTCADTVAHREERLRDRLVSGLHNKVMRQEILKTPINDLTLENVLRACRNLEASLEVNEQLGGKSVNAMSKKSAYKEKKLKKPFTSKDHSKKNKTWPCKACGMSQEKHGEKCFALDAECLNCQEIGHYKRVCPSLRRKKINLSKGRHDQQNCLTISSVGTSKELIFLTTRLGSTSKKVGWLPDSGAFCNALSLSDFKTLGGSNAGAKLSKSTETLMGADRSPLKTHGSVQLIVEREDRVYKGAAHVLDQTTAPLLCKDACVALGLLPEGWPHVAIQTLSLGSPEELGSAAKMIPNDSKVASYGVEAEKRDLLTRFKSVFDDEGPLRIMNGPPMMIELEEGAVPSRVFKPYSIPVHWKEKVKTKIDAMQEQGIVEDVPMGEAPEWIHPMVVVPKKSSDEPRITIDFSALNRYVKRPGYPTKVPRELVAEIPQGMGVFTTLDSRHGYWQVPLSDKSKPLTTFTTPWGLKRFCRNVMGLISAGDEHNRRGDEALVGLDNVIKVVEDILIFDREPGPTHRKRVEDVLQRCANAGITLGKKKFIYSQPSVIWCGYHLSKEGYTVNPALVEALKDFPVPKNKVDVRSFCGLVQQFEAFTAEIAELAKPLRSMLSPKVDFLWEGHQQKAFESLIYVLTSSRVLTHFRMGARLRLETDAAQSRGLGFALWQEEEDGRLWKLLQCGSRAVTPTESRYSATEIELLAVVWAVRKAHLFLRGTRFEVVVDHKPLIPIINAKSLAEIDTPRISRLKEKLQYSTPVAVWRQGVKHTTVDVFSRFPVSNPTAEDLEGEGDIEDYVKTIVEAKSKMINFLKPSEMRGKDATLEKIRMAGKQDQVYIKLLSQVEQGFPRNKDLLDLDLHPFWHVRDSLSVMNGVLLHGSRVMIPKAMRRAILEDLHAAHPGVERSLARARECVYWRGISHEIKAMVRRCPKCEENKASHQPEPLLQDPKPKWPGEAIAADLFHYAGKEYLVVVDKYSGWTDVYPFINRASTEDVKKHLMKWCTQLGLPKRISTDGGPQFGSGEFAQFCDRWNINHDPSSPYHHEANGYAEAAVKAMKAIILKICPKKSLDDERFFHALLEYRNTPRKDGISPAQRLFGRPTRTRLPISPMCFEKSIRERLRQADLKAEELRKKAKARHDRRSRKLERLKTGDIVRIQNPSTRVWDVFGKILECFPNGRSYMIRTETGRLKWRNRKFLRRVQHQEMMDPEKTNPDTKNNDSDTLEQPQRVRRSARKRRAPKRFGH